MACRALACAAFLLLAADVDASRRRRRRSCSGTTAQNNDNCNSLNAPPPCAPPPPPQYMALEDACRENWEERSRDEDYAGRKRTRGASGQWLEVITADRCVNVPALVEADDNSTSLLCDFAARREANYAASADPEAATIGPPQDGAWGSPSEGCLMPDAGGDDGDYLGYT